jgi:hypothetical protein
MGMLDEERSGSKKEKATRRQRQLLLKDQNHSQAATDRYANKTGKGSRT